LTLSSIGVTVDKPWSTSPDLKGHAAEIRHFVPALALALKRRGITSVEMAHVSAAFENLAKFYVELDSEVERYDKSVIYDFRNPESKKAHHMWCAFFGNRISKVIQH